MGLEVEIPHCLDHEECKKMASLVEQLSISGENTLNENLMKQLKKICKKSDDYVTHAYHLLLTQMNEQHAEIRFSVYLIINELFNRSHAFRELIVSEFQEFLELTTGINPDFPLPPPEAVARKLMTKTLESIQEWQKKYGTAYKKLTLGYNFLKNCKKIDFNNMEARTVAQRRRVNEQEEKKRIMLNAKLDKARKEIEEISEEINPSLVEVRNCFRLLFPHLEDFLQNDEDNCENISKVVTHSDLNTDAKETTKTSEAPLDGAIAEYRTIEAPVEGATNGEGQRGLLQESGLGSHSYNISITLKPGLSLAEDEDNTDILNNLRDQNRLINTKYLPTVIKCLAVFSKAGATEKELKSTIDLKQKLEAAKSQFSDLSVKEALGIKSFSNVAGPPDSDDDEFEDVPEKEGYEPVIPPHLRKDYGLDALPTTSSKMTPKEWDIKNLVRSKDDTKDPTTFAANIAKMHQKFASEAVGRMISDCKSSMNGSSSSPLDRKDKLLKEAPVLSFGFDLESWDNPNPEGPLVVKSMSLHRWWTPIENEETLSKGNLAALKSRTMKYTGEFVPVKWKCRAPLPNGRLCERMDRVKCPFHGKIIARDDLGIPENLQDDINASLVKMKKQNQGEKDPLALDAPDLQRDIEAATGLNLGSSKGKGKGKGKGKNSNLTNIKAEQDTSRKRLEKRVFNKRSLKRVGSALDNFDQKRHRDKFANQFHYSLPS